MAPRAAKKAAPSKLKGKASPKAKTKAKAKTSTHVEAESDSHQESSSDDDDDDDESEGYQEVSEDDAEVVEDEDDAISVVTLDSDDLEAEEVKVKKKRKSTGKTSSSSEVKKKKKSELDDGGKNTREIVTIPKAKPPKESADTHVILPSTMEFLKMLAKNNDRDWFSAHDALYRHALVNWTTWISALVPVASKVDWTLPPLPPKDLIHRIYRDVRFSASKIPYKTNFACSLSRTGRKGPFALYYFQIQPGGRSLLAAGKWQPSGEEIKIIRNALLHDPKPFRKIINAKPFVELFGEAKAVKGKRSSVFGHEDELKNAPKMEGVTKEHPDIDLLKLRSVAVSTTFTDEQVLAPNFLETVEKAMEVVVPFVQCLNEMIMPTPPDDDDNDDQNGGGPSEEEEDDDEE